MRIQAVSDIHLHFAKLTLPETDADVIVIAGDIDNGYKGIDWVINLAKEQDKPILVVLGNHEYYGKNYTYVAAHWNKRFAAEGVESNVTLLHKDSPVIKIKDTVFIGSTLWSDFFKGDPISVHMSNYHMNDFRCINTVGYLEAIDKSMSDRRFRAEDSLLEHKETLEAFREARDMFWEEKCVVISHHAPSYKSIHPKYGDTTNPVTGAYASDLEEFMEELRVNLWIHGHTHTKSDYFVNNTRVVCNPRGYIGHESGTGFSADLVLEV